MSIEYLYEVKFTPLFINYEPVVKQMYASDETDIERVLHERYDDEWHIDDVIDITPVFEIKYWKGDDDIDECLITAKTESDAHDIFDIENDSTYTSIQNIEHAWWDKP